jgi:hypothetical protein
MRDIPKKNIGPWAKHLIDACSITLQPRIERGIRYRNTYLSGSAEGEKQVYPLVFKHIDKLSSWLFSPVELRYALEAEAHPSAADIAMARRGSTALNTKIRRGKVATCAAQVNVWSLVKGVCFLKLLWGEDGLEPHVVQPESMGVLREDQNSLDAQEAFCHYTFYTPDQFADKIGHYPNAAELLRKVGKSVETSRTGGNTPDQGSALREIVMPGLYPYQSANAGPSRGKGLANWMTPPSATLDPRVQAQLIRYDELWVKDSDRRDWTTIAMVGDVVIDGELRHRNLLADPFDPDNPTKAIPADEDNPLSGHHPFVTFCPNRLDGYFWGMSEIELLELLQMSLNDRVNGINKLLRLQEDPPRVFSGSTIQQKAYSIGKKPGGMLSEANPAFKMQSLAPELPPGLWESLHEIVDMFRAMGGFTPSMQGMGDQGVRSNSQVESLIAVGSPEIKDRALLVEEAVEEVGGLALDILKAKDGTRYTGWIMPSEESVVASIAMHDDNVIEVPAKGMKPVPFLLHQLSSDITVRVDSHSSSPAFAHETQQLMFALAKIGAATPEDVVARVHPPNEEGIIAGLERRAIAQAEMVAKHPELAFKGAAGHKKK